MNRNTPESLMARVKKTENCWEWQGGLASTGYGQVSWEGKPQPTHRVFYKIFKGPIPDKFVIDHLCRNILCVKPEHLEAISYSENSLRGLTGLHNAQKTHCPS